MKRRGIQHHLDGLLALLLFGVFTVCVLSVLLTGARAYRRLTVRDQASYSRRTCAQYITTRVRQADCLGGVTVEPFGDAAALVFTEDGFTTSVYWHDGYLMELYAGEDAELSPEDGERIMEAESLSLSLRRGLLTVDITGDSGEPDRLFLLLRSGRGAVS